ncbi:aminotransferase class V-fold PLP-dependent enzyme [Lentibacillus sediminis]|uniref:aminotransferase class V-fold PLP-dependent enzyme n=1 Tax=Lentibacillus sediminis TaxID=1940529 RepID=UPI000C1BB9DF|nr:aminotransferase class V-fold PLP-dependent enzyme [Lentibacillus sediminis]
MNYSTTFTYKIADSQDEMDQIYRLNYETFVEEIPQHQTNEEGMLIDRFHEENIYVIAKRGDEVVGMIAVRGKRPFSLDQKLDNLDDYLSETDTPCEIRLLSIKPDYRGGRIFYGLCEKLVSHCLEKEYTVALISGTPRQTKLYRHVGFQPFGPLVGTEEAPYQPMYITKQQFEASSKVFQKLIQREEKAFCPYLLPGPVPISGEVKKAWQQPAISHRSADFHHTMQAAKDKLCALTKANHAEIVVGTGTLANDMVAAQLSTFTGKGLILTNGEFGERLIGHANRFGLRFDQLEKPWNTPITLEEVDHVLAANPDITWLWTVHCETSTGYVYPLQQLKEISQKHQVHICVDAASSVGVIPIDLSDVYLATTVSGKGLASFPGLAIVFHEQEISPNKHLPSSLDVGVYQKTGSVPFTHSSNGLSALKTALDNPCSFKGELAESVCQALADAGMDVLRGKGYSPGVISVQLPAHVSSREFGDQLKSSGVFVSYESDYLVKRNWFQVALMGEQERKKVMKSIRIITEQFQQMEQGAGIG